MTWNTLLNLDQTKKHTFGYMTRSTRLKLIQKAKLTWHEILLNLDHATQWHDVKRAPEFLYNHIYVAWNTLSKLLQPYTNLTKHTTHSWVWTIPHIPWKRASPEFRLCNVPNMILKTPEHGLSGSSLVSCSTPELDSIIQMTYIWTV